ncbi:MAG: metalloregulator ArsR/SmtB family transcription factor [Hyphomonadaceae bacterium]|nr:metalloregulator ArsR/SmtB family transcription factor [Hyphomonadaceae bacterium]
MIDLAPAQLAAFEAGAAAATAMLKALANERRLMILCQLGAGELSVGALQARLGMSQSALSQHLSVLREEGVVATRRAGQTIHYRIADPAAVRIIATLIEIYCPEKKA